MARKVFVSSDIAHDESLLEVAAENDVAALLWPWFLTVFDDWGRAEAHPLRLKAQVFPLNEVVTPAVIADALTLYEKFDLVVLYTVGGVRYMSIDAEKWQRWQTHIRWDRKSPGASSQFPDPPDTIPALDGLEPGYSVPSPTPPPTPSAAAATDGFTSFHEKRAAAEASRQKQAGIPVKNLGGLTDAIGKRSDFLAESKLLWTHRDCKNCKGTARIEFQPQAGGTTYGPCQEVVDV
jgi:hypothetical protein